MLFLLIGSALKREETISFILALEVLNYFSILNLMHVQCWAEICTLEFIFFLNWYIIDSFVHEWIVDFGKAKKIIAHLFHLLSTIEIFRIFKFFFFGRNIFFETNDHEWDFRNEMTMELLKKDSNTRKKMCMIWKMQDEKLPFILYKK